LSDSLGTASDWHNQKRERKPKSAYQERRLPVVVVVVVIALLINSLFLQCLYEFFCVSVLPNNPYFRTDLFFYFDNKFAVIFLKHTLTGNLFFIYFSDTFIFT